MPRLEQICDQLASGDAIAESNEESPVTHPGFRLWLSSYRSEAFPALVLRNGVKMTNEPPRGFAANMRRSCLALRPQLATLTEQAIEPEAAHRLFFGLCMFHAVVEGRRDFGALGWNVRYEFSVSDLQITTRQLCFYAKTSQTVSGAVAAVARLAGDCNYGGRLADERDRRALLALLEDYCTEDVSREGYCAQGLAGFTAPAGARDVQAHVQHIQSMPQDEPPELFGLHANASVARTLRETHSICG
jgi:dynein heavy chain